jgi:hypothetical protein
VLNAEVHIVDGGHFALDTAADHIAQLVRAFMPRSRRARLVYDPLSGFRRKVYLEKTSRMLRKSWKSPLARMTVGRDRKNSMRLTSVAHSNIPQRAVGHPCSPMIRPRERDTTTTRVWRGSDSCGRAWLTVTMWWVAGAPRCVSGEAFDRTAFSAPARARRLALWALLSHSRSDSTAACNSGRSGVPESETRERDAAVRRGPATRR